MRIEGSSEVSYTALHSSVPDGWTHTTEKPIDCLLDFSLSNVLLLFYSSILIVVFWHLSVSPRAVLYTYMPICQRADCLQHGCSVCRMPNADE